MRYAATLALLLVALAAHAAEEIVTTQPEDPKPPAPGGLRALVNQVGYDVGAPKRVVVQADGPLPERFDLLDAAGTVAFSAPLVPAGRIVGAYATDWGFNYALGDFSTFDIPARGYRVRVKTGDTEATSPPFAIGKDLLWNATAMPAVAFFYYQRCGFEVPGFHKACHLDDAVSPDRKTQHDLVGGWHDAGDYNKYQNAPYVYALARAYAWRRDAFDALTPVATGQVGFLDELRWGGAHVLRMLAPDGSAYGEITTGYRYWGAPELETDNKPGTGDERPIRGNETGNDPSEHAAALARLALLDPTDPRWREGAERALAWCFAHGQRGPRACSAALDLHALTREARWADEARTMLPAPSADPATVDLLRHFDALTGEDHAAALRTAALARAEEFMALSRNPFGIPSFGSPEAPNFFGAPEAGTDLKAWHVGNSSRVLEAATAAALAWQYTRDAKYRAYALRQFDWILGVNPYALCLMEGVGTLHAPTYHHRYIRAGVPRGAVPGGIPNGITYRAPGIDAPYFDMTGVERPRYEPNEVWLPHNTNYLNALAALTQAGK